MAKATAKRHARLVVLIGMIMSLFSLLGCLPLFNAFPREPNLDEVASRVVAAFEGNSVEPIEGILSQSALETDGLLDGISYGHELLAGGKVEKIEMYNKVEGDQFKDGKSDKSYSCLYDVYTNNGRYCLSLHFFSKNYIYPEDRGLYRVFFVTEERNNQEAEKRDEQLSTEEFPPHWNYGATYEKAGVYNPGWETAPPPDGHAFQRY